MNDLNSQAFKIRNLIIELLSYSQFSFGCEAPFPNMGEGTLLVNLDVSQTQK